MEDRNQTKQLSPGDSSSTVSAIMYSKELKQLPLRYRDIDTIHKEKLEAAFNESAFLTGKPGTGKTVLAASLAKKYIGRGIKIKWLSYPALIMELQSLFRHQDKDPWDEAKEVARFTGALFLDDLGAEKLTDFVRQITYYIINEREQRCLITIITSNFSLAQIDEQIDSRVSSRIAGMCAVIKLIGEDKRINGNGKKR